MGYSNIRNLFRSFLLEFSSRSFSPYHWLFQSPSQFLMTIFFLSFKHSWLLPILFRNTEELWYRTGEGNGTPLQYLAWKIPWMEESDRLQSMGSQRVRHNWATSLSFPFLYIKGIYPFSLLELQIPPQLAPSLLILCIFFHRRVLHFNVVK